MAELILKLPPVDLILGEWELTNPNYYNWKNQTFTRTLRRNLFDVCKVPLGVQAIVENTVSGDYYIIDLTPISHYHYSYSSFDPISFINKMRLMSKEYFSYNLPITYPITYPISSPTDFYTPVIEPNALQVAMKKFDDFIQVISTYPAFL